MRALACRRRWRVLAAGCGGSGKVGYTGGRRQGRLLPGVRRGRRALTRLLGRRRLPLARELRPARAAGDAARSCSARSATSVAANMIQPRAGEPVGQFVVAAKRASDDHARPRSPRARSCSAPARSPSAGWMRSAAAHGQVPAPATRSAAGRRRSSAPTASAAARSKRAGWKGFAQQIAHTYPPGQDDVYYEDITHVVLHRANVILYLDVTHQKSSASAPTPPPRRSPS